MFAVSHFTVSNLAKTSLCAVVAGLFSAGGLMAQSGGTVLGQVIDSSGSGAVSSQTIAQVAPSAGAVFVGDINTCFSQIEGALNPDASVKLQIDVNKYGDPSTLVVLAPGPLSTTQRAILRATSTALIDCTPLSGAAAQKVPASYTVIARVDGLSRIKKESVAPLPTGIAPVVSASDQSGTSAIGTKATENALNLSRHDKREIQRRLSLIDYNPNGIDGKFGTGTRRAIRAWQRDVGLPNSGYLNGAQLAQLKQASAKKYAIWDAKPKRYYDKKGCLREPNGRVVLGRTALCDLGAIFQ